MDIDNPAQSLSALVDTLETLYQEQPASNRSNLKFLAVEYGYGERIIDRGKLQFPHDSGNLIGEFTSNDTLPLGIITRNACEVTSYISAGEGQIDVADALLMPGEFLGLFETIDRLAKLAKPPTPLWNVNSGASTIYSAIDLTTRQSRKRLRQFTDETISQLPRNSSLIDQLKQVDIFDDIARSWYTRVIYFSNDWLRALFSGKDSAAANAAAREFTLRAWHNMARIRDKDPSAFQQCLAETARRNGKYFGHAEEAGIFLKRVNDVIWQRHPFYVGKSENDATGPFGEISEHILGQIDSEMKWAFAPSYCTSNTSVGFAKLDHLMPGIFARRGSARGYVDELMRLPVAGSSRENTMLIEPFREIISLLDHIIFKTPKEKAIRVSTELSTKQNRIIEEKKSAKKTQNENRSENIKVGTFCFRLNTSATKLLTKNVELEAFYQPLPVLKKECDFFSSSVRIAKDTDAID